MRIEMKNRKNRLLEYESIDDAEMIIDFLHMIGKISEFCFLELKKKNNR